MLRTAVTQRLVAGWPQPARAGTAIALPGLRMLAGGVGLLTAAYLYSRYLPAATALVIPGLVIVGLIGRRWPAGTMIAAAALDSAYGSLNAFLHLPGNGMATVLLTGLLVATLGGFVFGRRQQPALIWPAVIAAGLYLSLTLLLMAFSPAASPAFKVVRTGGLYMLTFLVIAYGPWRRGTHDRVRAALIFVGLLIGGYATLRWGIGASAKEKALVTSSIYNTVGTQSKVQGSFPSGVELGIWTSAMIPFLLASALTLRGRLRLIAALALPLCAVGLLGSGLRVGLAAALAGCGLALIAYGFARSMGASRIGVALGVVLALTAGGVALFPAIVGHDPNTVRRYHNLLTPSRDTSVVERLYKWRQALIDTRGHPFGHGLGTIGPESTQQRFMTNTYAALDSSYLRIAYEQGLAVMALFVVTLLLLLGGLLRRGMWTRVRERAGPAIGAAGTLAAMMIVMIADLVTTTPATLAAWVIVGLGVAPFTRLDSAGRQPSNART